MRFLYEHPTLGPTEQDIGFRCECGFVHPPGGIAITLREPREVRFYCQHCGKLCGSWTPPVPAASPVPVEGVMRVACSSCDAVALLPLPMPDGAMVHCVHCGASTPVPTSPVDPDSPAGDDDRERST